MIKNEDRLSSLKNYAGIAGVPFIQEVNAAYLARAVSSVPIEQKERLETIFQEIISAVTNSGLEALLPVELKKIEENQINPKNHELLLKSKIVLPLTYATSDGRGWEMGFSYTKKLLVPLLLPDQIKKTNTPSIKLPFQIPVIYESADSLTLLLSELNKFDSFNFGTLDGNQTIIADIAGDLIDLKKLANKFVDIYTY